MKAMCCGFDEHFSHLNLNNYLLFNCHVSIGWSAHLTYTIIIYAIEMETENVSDVIYIYKYTRSTYIVYLHIWLVVFAQKNVNTRA